MDEHADTTLVMTSCRRFDLLERTVAFDASMARQVPEPNRRGGQR